MLPNYIYKAKVIRVIDGDTLVLNIDVGFRMFAEMPIRLYGINAPERGKEGWAESKDKVWDLIGDGNVTVEIFKNPEKYGRWLGIVYYQGENLNEFMVAGGYAVRS